MTTHEVAPRDADTPPLQREDKKLREALAWLKSRHLAPCGLATCDSAYCFIATRLTALEADRERQSDYRAGYSTGYADAKAKRPMRDEEAAALFAGCCPLWDVMVPYYDTNHDEEGPACFDVEIYALDEATAVERAVEQLHAEMPTAWADFERAECARHTTEPT